MLRRIRTYERAGHRYSLYEGGSWVLFEDHGGDADEIGTIATSGGRYAIQPRFHPDLALSCPTLDQAVETLLTIHETGGKP